MSFYHCPCPNCEKDPWDCSCPIQCLPPKYQMGPLNSELLTVSMKLQQVINYINRREKSSNETD